MTTRYYCRVCLYWTDCRPLLAMTCPACKDDVQHGYPCSDSKRVDMIIKFEYALCDLIANYNARRAADLLKQLDKANSDAWLASDYQLARCLYLTTDDLLALQDSNSV